jgi:hypothetical protein
VEININDRLVELYHREEIMWRQHSWVEWLSQGDKNSRFFHQRASMCKQKNLIKLLLRLGEQLIEDMDELKLMASNLYKSLYTSEGVQDMNKGFDHVTRKVMIVMNESFTRPSCKRR